jgi:hypothetical protein
MLRFDLDFQGERILRKAMKLSAKMGLVALGHVCILFISYGRKWMRFLPSVANLSIYVWLALPSSLAFFLYYIFLAKSGFLSEHNRRAKLTAWSLAASVFSLYLGVFFSLNTFGE